MDVWNEVTLTSAMRPSLEAGMWSVSILMLPTKSCDVAANPLPDQPPSQILQCKKHTLDVSEFRLGLLKLAAPGLDLILELALLLQVALARLEQLLVLDVHAADLVDKAADLSAQLVREIGRAHV